MRKKIISHTSKIIKSKIFIFIINIVMAIVFSISSYKVISLQDIYDYISWKYIIILILSTSIILYYLWYVFKNKYGIEWIYLIIILPISCCYILFQPYGHKFDEPQHFYKVYDISNGNLFTNKNKEGYATIEVPQDIIDYNALVANTHTKLEEFCDIKTDYNKTLVTSSTAASYTFAAYIPSVLGVYVAKILNLNIFGVYYLCRMFANLFTIILGFFSIKNLKNYKMLLFVVLLNPLYIHQQTAVSGDAVLNALSIYYVAKIFSSVQNKSINFKSIIGLIFILGVIISIKVTYFPLVILLLLLPKQKMTLKQKFSILITIIIAIIHIFLYLTHSHFTNESAYVIENLNTIEQMKFIISNPFKFISIFLHTLKIYGDHYINMLFGSRLAWGDLNMTSGIIFAYYALIVLSPFLENIKEEFTIKQKVIILLSVLSVFFVTFGAIYLQWNPVGSELINGFQGRYLIPILFPILILFAKKNNSINVKNWKITLLLVLINVVTLIEIYNAYL